MKTAALVGACLVLLLTAAANAQVVGGYSTIVPTQIGQSPVFDTAPPAHAAPNHAAPTYAAPAEIASTAPANAPTPARPLDTAEHAALDRAVRTAALQEVADETHSVLKPVSLNRDVTASAHQAPLTFRPVEEEKLKPIPVSYTGGTAGAAYYAPSLAGQVIPVQASAPVAVTQSECCTPCISCCMPVAQAPPATVIQQPATIVQPPVAVASTPSQLPPGYIFGRGLLYQPVVFVEGQPVRNFLRYISP